MLRLIRKTLFILSLLLALATAALWIRSYWWFDQAMWRRESLRADHRGYFTLALFAETARDRIKIGLVSKNIELREGDLVSGSYHHRLLSGPDSGCIFQTDSISLEPNLKQYLDVEMKGFAGFNVDYGARTFKSGQSFSHRAHWADLTLPLWLPTFLFLMPVLFQIRRGLKHRFRRRRGLCSTCGYDIRANFDVCPECGAETVQPPSSAA